MTLAEKLHPDRFSAMSGKMAAILGYVLNQAWTEPSDPNAVGHVRWLRETFRSRSAASPRNSASVILNLLIAAGLTADERSEFERRCREGVDDWRPVLTGPRPADERLTRPDFSEPDSRA